MPNTRRKKYLSPPLVVSTPKSTLSNLFTFRAKKFKPIRELFKAPSSQSRNQSRLSNYEVLSSNCSSSTHSNSSEDLPSSYISVSINKTMPNGTGKGDREEGKGKGSDNKGGLPQQGTACYKNVITWIRSFDGSFEKYMRFANDCDICFKAIRPTEYADLLFYVRKQLDENKFAFLLGTDFQTWEVLKKSLDEHFNIRLNERLLFRQITDLKKIKEESLLP